MLTMTPDILRASGYVVDFDENTYQSDPDAPVTDPVAIWTRRHEDKFTTTVVCQSFTDGRPTKVIVAASFRKDGRIVAMTHHDAERVTLRSIEQSFEDAWAFFKFDELPPDEAAVT